MRLSLSLCALACLSGCDGGPGPAEQRMRDDADNEAVIAANKAPPPIREVTPEPIGFPDMERYSLAGPGCSYAPGTSFGTRVIARSEDAYIKVDGEMLRLAADTGSPMLPANTRARYNGRSYILSLSLNGEGEAAPNAPGSTNFDGRVALRDAYGRIVFDGEGLAQCTAPRSVTASDPNLKFASPEGKRKANFRFRRVTSNQLELVWFQDLKFARDQTAH